ncbi:hypothetical protein FD754_010470 [Muntiacus muntjak]|uniref:Protein tyrosine phosphatase type IVA 3 n=1 Tax=Muntiacus muntjak TaxID=9888 RepID=A0A5N3WXZ9_MUNMU|nr:hypothetical protein FD754_010470 [Muntiacus muntjak]
MNHAAPMEVTHKKMRFVITHNPTNVALNKVTEELKKYGGTTIGKCVKKLMTLTLSDKEGIQVLNWHFENGTQPSHQIVDDHRGCCIAVRCIAGLGRVPVLVTLAVTEGGMKYEDAAQFIRQKWLGAFNSKPLLYLEKHGPKMRLCFKDSNGHRNNCCI